MLTVSVNGYGKRTSSYEYRTTGRGGKGIVAMSVNNRNGKLVASFPVEDSDQIMLVTDKGQLIRCPVEGIRIAGRSTQGVIVFDTAEDEHVVSVEHIGEEENGNGERRVGRRWSAARPGVRQTTSKTKKPSGGIPRVSIQSNLESKTGLARLRRAVGGDQAGFADDGLAAGGAQAGGFEIRPGLLRAVAADRR